jgi:hypothetical protein
MFALAAAACGDDGNTVADARPADAPPVAVDAAPPVVALDCPTYCAQSAANCTGLNAQYPTNDQCLATCGKWAVDGKVTDTTGNTLGCRIYHSGAPAKMTPATHCVHSGPAGNQVNAAGSVCGEACESFCKLNLATCTGALAQYTDMATCVTACGGFEKTSLYLVDSSKTPVATPRGDSLACRIYHTTNAALSAGAATTHCPHTPAVPVAGTPCTGAPSSPM